MFPGKLTDGDAQHMDEVVILEDQIMRELVWLRDMAKFRHLTLPYLYSRCDLFFR